MNIKEIRLEKNQKIYEDLQIKRKPFISKKTGKRCDGYYINGVLKGSNVIIALKSRDKTYTSLDIVFSGTDKVYLLVQSTVTFSGDPAFNYFAVSIDEEDGTLLRANIVPTTKTNEDLLKNLIEKIDNRQRIERREVIRKLEEEEALEQEDAEALENEESLEEESTQEIDGVKHIDDIDMDEELLEEPEDK